VFAVNKKAAPVRFKQRKTGPPMVENITGTFSQLQGK
jgi:hypothetical protein